MPRRFRPEKREVEPDLRYGSKRVSMFVNRLMKDGKKSTARTILYDAFEIMEERMNRPALEVFEQALDNAMPRVEVRPRRVGGSTYQVPVEVPPNRRVSLGMRWLLAAARSRGGRSMAENLSAELMDAYNNQGAAVKRKDDAHRMAEANRAFAHYRF
jgi:small subunit ribosomal protein S7